METRLTGGGEWTAGGPGGGAWPPSAERPHRRGSEVRRTPRWYQRHPRGAWAAGLTIAGLVLFLAYLRDAQTYMVNSDPAAQVLQAWQMWHGNPLLRGWWLGDVSFYTIELPLNVVIEMTIGLRPGDIHVLAALVYTAMLLFTALLARGRSRGWPGIVSALLAAGIVAAPSMVLGTRVLLQGPDHLGTMIPILLAMLVLDRAPERWPTIAVVAALLTWAQISDAQATFSGALAVAAACTVRALTQGTRRRRLPSGRGYDVALVVAMLASIVIAHVILSGIHSAGGFFVPAPKDGYGLAPIAKLPTQLWVTGSCLLILFGADFVGQPTGASTVFALLHLVGVALGFTALLVGLRGFLTRMDRVTQALVAGTMIILAAGVFGNYMAPISGAHEIIPVLPFCAVLAGRLLGSRLAAARLVPVLAAGLVVMIAALGYNDIQPKQTPAQTALAGWLEAHHLTSGLAGYWESNITTVDSGGRVRLISVTRHGTTALPYESDASWYDPLTSQANFIVSVSGHVASKDLSPVSPAVVRVRYGKPARIYHFENYTIMVYDYNLLTRVIVPTGPWPGFRPG